MPRNGSATSIAPHFCGVTSAATAPSFLGYVGVRWREFVAVFAVCARSLARAVSLSAKGKAINIDTPLSAGDFLEGKSLRSAHNDSVGFQSVFFSKLAGQICFTLNQNLARIPLISLLLALCGPSTILGRIGAIIVIPINRLAGWSRTHIGNELREGIPLSADSNASAAVVFPLLTVWIEAAISHAAPNHVKRVRVFERHGKYSIRPCPVMQVGG